MTIDEAATGEEALAKVHQREFDLILEDVVMPGLDGYAFLRTVRYIKNELNLPLMMTTANNDIREMVDAFSLGANDYVTQPIDAQVLLARMLTHRRTPQSMNGPSRIRSLVSLMNFRPTSFVSPHKDRKFHGRLSNKLGRPFALACFS